MAWQAYRVCAFRSQIMLEIIGTTLLLYAACGLLYQADQRRAAFEGFRTSQPLRFGARAIAVFLAMVALFLIAPLQGWERGITIWLGIFSFVFVIGLFLAAQRPNLHQPVAIAAGATGIVATLGALI